MQKGSDSGFEWAGLPVIPTVARLLCRELTLQNEYLRVENRSLKEKVSGRSWFTDEERRPLMRMSSARETALRVLWCTDEFLDTSAIIRHITHRTLFLVSTGRAQELSGAPLRT